MYSYFLYVSFHTILLFEILLLYFIYLIIISFELFDLIFNDFSYIVYGNQPKNIKYFVYF